MITWPPAGCRWYWSSWACGAARAVMGSESDSAWGVPDGCGLRKNARRQRVGATPGGAMMRKDQGAHQRRRWDVEPYLTIPRQENATVSRPHTARTNPSISPPFNLHPCLVPVPFVAHILPQPFLYRFLAQHPLHTRQCELQRFLSHALACANPPPRRRQVQLVSYIAHPKFLQSPPTRLFPLPQAGSSRTPAGSPLAHPIAGLLRSGTSGHLRPRPRSDTHGCQTTCAGPEPLGGRWTWARLDSCWRPSGYSSWLSG